MKKITLIALLVLNIFNCYSQNLTEKYLVGASVNYSHDDLKNNRLLSNYFPYESNYSNSFEVVGEFGQAISQNGLLGIDIGFYSNKTMLERESSNTSNADISNSKSNGILVSPKYKYLRGISEKIWFYSDFKFVFQYINHKNKFSNLNPVTSQNEYAFMNGNELSYGISVSPGLIFKISNAFGVKIDYSLVNVHYSTIGKADDSDVSFEDINAWDYNLNMNLSELNLGIIFTL